LVFLDAAAETCWRFDRWEGGLSGSETPAMIVLRSDRLVRAVFVRDILDAPGQVSASDGTDMDSVHVMWAPVANATSYYVYRNDTDYFPGATRVAVVVAPTTAYADASAVASDLLEQGGCFREPTPIPHAHYYWIVAVGPCGESPRSEGDTGYRAIDTPVAPARLDLGSLLAVMGVCALLFGAESAFKTGVSRLWGDRVDR